MDKNENSNGFISSKKTQAIIDNDPAKNNIMGWCKADHLKCVDESLNNPTFSWAILVGDEVMIYKQPHLSDRIYIQSQITISPEHQTLIETKPDMKNNLMLNLTTNATNLNIGINFQIVEGKLKGVNLSKVHFADTISKADLLRNFLRVQQVHQTILNQLRSTLGLEFQQSKVQTTQPNDSDVGIG